MRAKSGFEPAKERPGAGRQAPKGVWAEAGARREKKHGGAQGRADHRAHAADPSSE